MVGPSTPCRWRAWRSAEADFDRPIVAVAFDLVLAFVHAAAGGEAHVVFPLDDERRRQGDGQQHARQLRLAAADLQRGLAFDFLRAGLRLADDGEPGDVDLRLFVRLEGQIDCRLIGPDGCR